MIKMVAYDVDGTIIPHDFDEEFPFLYRYGVGGLMDFLNERGVKSVITSKSSSVNIRLLLTDSIKFARQMRMEERILRMEDFFEFDDEWPSFLGRPKNFEYLIDRYKIEPDELLVVGDSYVDDVIGALNVGAKYYQVPEYREPSECYKFDFNQIRELF